MLKFRSISRAFIALSCGFVLAACGDSGTTDAGTDAGTDTGVGPADLGPRDTGADTGPRDFGSSDAGTRSQYCVGPNNTITNPPANVPLTGPADNIAKNETGNNASLTCIDDVPAVPLGAGIRIEGCLQFIGAAPTLAQLQGAIEGDVFLDVDDPSFDHTTGIDRGNRLEVTTEVTDQAPQCPSGLALQLGAQTGLASDIGYTIRVRSSSGAASRDWVTTYYQGVLIRPEQVRPFGSGNCNAATCFATFNLPLIRRSELQSLITEVGGVNGGNDLDDGVGDGYAFLNPLDCSDSPMTDVVAGFDATPAGAGYLDTNGSINNALTATGDFGVYAGIGFATTSSTGDTVYGGVGVRRFAGDNECTEGYGHAGFTIWPDALSFMRFGRETTFNP